MTKFYKFQKILIVILVAIGFFYGGYYFGKRGYLIEVRKNPPKIEIVNRNPSSDKVDFNLFWEVWDKVSADYLDRPVDSQKMLYGSISGMVNSLGDPYTSFLPPAVNKNVTEAIDGNYQGIGAELGFKETQLVVISALDGSPAKAAGVAAGDEILEVNGESTAGISLNEAVAKIRGEAGTIVTLKLRSNNQEPRAVTIKRGVVTVASVSWSDKGNGIAYIRVSSFGSDTDNQWSKAVSEINTRMKQLDSVIVDVRGNPGGYLQSAVYIAGEFYSNKPVLYEETALGEDIALNADRMGIFTKVPVVFVLIDKGSASASEILAAALREQIGAKLIGEKSFGKGTIQDAKNFSDGSGLHITIAKWLTPKKEWIHKIGLTPDIEVPRTSDDINKGLDKQLDKAIELAKQF